VVIGANDLTHLVPATRATAALRDAVGRLRDAGSEVVVAPAPDLSMVPHVPPAMRPLVRAASEELRRQQVAVATALGAEVADLDGGTARAFEDDPRLFSADRFHPSSAGYAVIAEALLPAVLRAFARSARPRA
jgi:lysophospholipase L1-like esterase